MGDVRQINAKLWQGDSGFWHWCPGCERSHPLPAKFGWTFDGNLDAPTFNPSFKQSRPRRGQPDHVCHYFLHGGVLKFCSDSMHSLAGQEVPLPDIPSGRTIFDDIREER